MSLKEEKAAKDSVKTARFELFIDPLGRIPTGSTISAPCILNATDPTTFYHFLPHLSCKSFIVKQKLATVCPTRALTKENAKPCGESNE